MYEYRKLNSAERAEILRYRREQGYPLHAPPHPATGEGVFLITAANFEHNHILANSSRRTSFETTIFQILKRFDFDVRGWVILPNHYHLLVHTHQFQKAGMMLKQLHGKTAHEWNFQDNLPGRKVWFNYSDRKIRGERHYYASLNYIHFNPVKHGYVTSPEEWPWSSIGLYIQDYGAQWIKDKWDAFPVMDFGKGWDDGT